MRIMSSFTPRLRLPKRIILVRHGESLGNVDPTAYERIPDWKIPITESGREQGFAAGKSIKSLIGDETLSIYCSPYLRTKETLACIMDSLGDNPLIHVREEPRLTEQQFGNFQTASDMMQLRLDRSEYGRFYYRFPEGESGLDCYNRVTSFISTLFREWHKDSDGDALDDNNVLLVTHGLFVRLFLMRWFQYTVTEFERTANPANGAVLVMERKPMDDTVDGAEHMELTEESRAQLKFVPQHKHNIHKLNTAAEHLARILDSIAVDSLK